jgi:Chaperone of endosialidase
MRGTIASYVLMVLVFGLAGGAVAGVPMAVSPGGENAAAVISQECPTFSWSQVEGAVSYRVRVFEMVHEKIDPLEIMEKTSEPVMEVEIKAPAFSWTPSGECLESGKRYVWFVGAISDNPSSPPLNVRGGREGLPAGGEEGLRQWSEGRRFEIDILASLGLTDAVKEKVTDYLTKEWAGTATFKEVKEGIKLEVLREIGGRSRTAGREGVVALGYEGDYNTFYGQGAGDSIPGVIRWATFIGANAGNRNTTGSGNTFLGSYTGYWNTTGGDNSFLGSEAGYSNTTGDANTFLGERSGYYNSTGYYNTFVGEEAGYHNNGNFNTFLGALAGQSNTTGNFNTFLGQIAGGSNTTGDHNTFLGQSTGYSNTTGNFNSYLGKEAGFRNTTGYNNVFLGYRAGYLNTEGLYNTFAGNSAGYSNNTGDYNSFLGNRAGYANTEGSYNTFLGNVAGDSNTVGDRNTFVGFSAGGNNTDGNNNTFLGVSAGSQNVMGSYNVFLGYSAGSNETGSQKLYISNSNTSTPLIYGEFDNSLLRINGSGHFSGKGISKSQLHFSKDNTDTGGWITSVGQNNFWHSSGAMWEASLGGWVQKSSDGLAVMAGSGPAGYRVLTRSGCDVDTVCSTPATRLTVDYSGRVGIGVTPSHLLHLAGGAYSDGATWVDGSSREYKDNIRDLTKDEALSAFQGLNPVAFTYKAGGGEQHVGFIAEDVPDLVATKDRKGLSSMDIVAVLTKVVQEQQKTISILREELNGLKEKVR